MTTPADLPKKKRTNAKPKLAVGWNPDDGNRFTHAPLVEAFTSPPFERTSSNPLGVSDAGKCARLLGYKILGIPKSNPIDDPGIIATGLGTVVHKLWQDAVTESADLASVETEVRVEPIEGLLSGYIDLVATVGNTKTAVEFKTIASTGYRYATGTAYRDRPAEGPRPAHVLQGAIGALELGADELVIAYFAKENIVRFMRSGDTVPEHLTFAAEWTIDYDTFAELAEAELDRMHGIAELVESGSLPRRILPSAEFPQGAEVVDPGDGTWHQTAGDQLIDVGRTWECGYCSHQEFCATTEPGRITTTAVQLHSRHYYGTGGEDE